MSVRQINDNLQWTKNQRSFGKKKLLEETLLPKETTKIQYVENSAMYVFLLP